MKCLECKGDLKLYGAAARKSHNKYYLTSLCYICENCNKMNIFSTRPKIIPNLDINLIYIPFMKELDHIKILFPANRIIIHGIDKKDKEITVPMAYDTKNLVNIINNFNLNDLDLQYIDPEYKCLNCGSREHRINGININISKNFTITRAIIKCSKCKQSKTYNFYDSPIQIPHIDIIKQKYEKYVSKLDKYCIYLSNMGNVILYGQDINTSYRLRYILYKYNRDEYNNILLQIYRRIKLL